MRKILISVFLVLIFCTYSQAESLVWKVQKGDSVMYVGGTIHILRQSDFPLPEEFNKAYSLSDMLVLEADIGKMNDPSVQQKLLSKAMYTDGSTIEQHLATETYKLLNDYCTSNGIPLEQLKMFKPQLVVVMMEVMELAKFGVVQEGVDMVFYKSATNDKKVIEGFETIDEQIELILGMGKGNEGELIAHTISELKSTKENFEVMADAWKKGDDKKLYEFLVDKIKSKSPEIYKTLLVDRNNNWLPVIEKYFENQKTEFILVGAAHVVGPDGIIEMLIKKGCKVGKL